MKQLILSLALVMGLTAAVCAQDAKPQPKKTTKQERANLPPEDRAKNESERAAKDLGLTADQKSKWEAASLERIKANAPLREKLKGSTTPEERKTIHGQVKGNMQKFDASVNSFLTADQKTKWDAMKEKRKQKKQQHHKGGKDEPVLDDED